MPTENEFEKGAVFAGGGLLGAVDGDTPTLHFDNLTVEQVSPFEGEPRKASLSLMNSETSGDVYTARSLLIQAKLTVDEIIELARELMGDE